jgi:hypothetical protein
MKKNFLFLVLALVALTTALPLRAQMRIYRNNSQIANKSANVFFNTDGSGNWSVVNAKSDAYDATMDLSRIDSISVVDNVIHVTGLSLMPAKTSLLGPGDKGILQPVFTPSNATNQEVEWATSDPDIVAIIGDTIFGVSPGTATVTATCNADGGFTATCTVTVCIDIPDAVFQKYCVDNFDQDNDGGISVEEAAAATKIECENLDIRSTKGLQWFTNLTELRFGGAKNLTGVNVSKNTKLENLHVYNDALNTIDVSMLKNLKGFNCEGNKLTVLNVSANTALIGLTCSNNDLEHLDVSANTLLQSLGCDRNHFESLDLSKNTALRFAYVGNQTDPWGNGQDVSISVTLPEGADVSKLLPDRDNGVDDPDDQEYIGNNRINIVSIGDINIPDATFRAYCLSNFDTNKDGKLSFSEAAAAKTIDVGRTAVASLEGIQYFTGLTMLECSFCKLEGTLDLSTLKSLISFQCGHNNLTKLILPNGGSLQRLQCDHNRISALDLMRCGPLEIAYIGAQTSDGTNGIYIKATIEDEASYIEESVFPDLNKENTSNARVAIPIIFRDDNFEAYCVSHFDTNKDGVVSREEAKTVTEISCPGSKIDNLVGLKYFTNLENLNVGNNNISYLTLDDFKALKSVSASYIPSLTGVSAKNCSALTELNVYGGGVSYMNITGCSALKSLYCWGNRLKSLDLNGVNALTTAYVGTQTSDGVTPQVITLMNTALPESVFPHFAIDGYSNTFVVFDGRNIQIPDEYLKKHLKKYDTDGDGEISYKEAMDIETTYVDIKMISHEGSWSDHNNTISLKGLRYFQKMVHLDLSVISGYHNCFTDFSELKGLPSLKYFMLQGYDNRKCLTQPQRIDTCYNYVLDNLNPNKIVQVHFDLCHFFTRSDAVTINVVVPYLPRLEKLILFGEQTRDIKLDVSNCPNLSSISCISVLGLKGLVLPNNSNLSELECYYTGLSELDVSKQMHLETLRCNNNVLRELHLENHPVRGDFGRQQRVPTSGDSGDYVNLNVYITGWPTLEYEIARNNSANARITWIW